MEGRKMQQFTLDDLGIIAFPVPQIDGSDNFEVDADELRRSDEKNNHIRAMIRKGEAAEGDLKQM